MRILGFYWGVLGVIGLIGSAVYRLSPRVMELRNYSLSPLQWGVLLGFGAWMLYAEGFKGFHLNFAPRVVARACHLRHHSRPVLAVLAPMFCMGYIHATRRRQLTSILVTSAIVGVVLVVRLLPQPWRGIIDVGVIGGLVVGIASLLWHFGCAVLANREPAVSIDLPER